MGNPPKTNDAADSVEGVVDQHPWLEQVTQIGWLAKGVVYTLIGITALQIASQSPSSDDDSASPKGALGNIADAPGGRFLLGFLTLGLILYCLWRILSVAVIRGNDLEAWAHRIGYGFSALFYAGLAWTAGKATFSDTKPDDSDSVSSISKTVLEWPVGRWLLGAFGIGTIAVGLYFAIHKGIQRSFAEDLEGVSKDPSGQSTKHTAIIWSGVVGWLGRGAVTVLVGYFITRAAIQFDPDDAKGFDQSLREVAGSTIGTILVLFCAVGLIAYGIFCFASHRHRELDDNT